MHSVKSQGRRLEKQKENLTEAPQFEREINIMFDYTPEIYGGKTVLDMNIPELYAPQSDRLLSKDIRLEVRGSDKVCIIGKNGAGKTTLIKMIKEELEHRKDISMAYMPQNYEELMDANKTPMQFLEKDGSKEERVMINNRLASLRFTPDDMVRKIGYLSGGQRAKLMLLSLTISGADVLILDEPTNHMDMIGKETLEAMLASFPGTVIFVSHDRYFVKKVATQILDMRVDGAWLYPFGYEDYESRERPAPFRTGPATTTEPSMGITTSQAERLAGKEADRRKRQKKKLEDKIESIEKEIEELKEELCKPEYASMYSKLTEIQNEIDAKEEELLNVMEEWDNS